MENKYFTGVLMAAGMGMRLGGATTKALVEVEGRPLLQYAIDFLKAAGAGEIIVVGGFCFGDLKKKILEYDADVKILENADYKKGNLYTLMRALPHINGSFLLCNADHIYRRPIADKVKEQLSGVTAFCDFDRNLGDDDMKVWHEEKVLRRISKKLDEYNGGYVGLTYCDESVLPFYKSIVEELSASGDEKAVVEDVLRHLAARGHNVGIGDISGHGWLEIDFPEELEKARRTVASDRDSFIFNPDFTNKWKNINAKKSADEPSLFVPKGFGPLTQRQINLYWYYRFFEKFLQGKNYKKGLELGCGRGTMSLYLNKYRGMEVALSDISEDAVKLAKENFKEYGADGTFAVAASDALPFADNSFDIVYSIGLLEHLQDYGKTLAEARRVLAPGGAFISLNIPAKWSAQNLNNLYKKSLKFLSGKEYPAKDYWRNGDSPEDYAHAAEAAGFGGVRTINVNPFPIFVPVSQKADRGIAAIYNLIIKAKSLFSDYPFEASPLFSQGHFLVGYK